jgi:hypothetical protein
VKFRYIVVGLAIAVLIGAAGLNLDSSRQIDDPGVGEAPPEEYEETQTEGEGARPEEGVENPDVGTDGLPTIIVDFEYTVLPAPEEYVGSITPLGWLGASVREHPDVPHPLANERHHIFFNDGFTSGIEIYAPGPGYVEWASISPLNEWGFTIIVDEDLSYYLDHIGYLNSTLEGQIRELGPYDEGDPTKFYVNRRIKVNAGQVIGYTNNTHFFDWGTVDRSVIDGISNRSHYSWERHIYGVSAYGYSSDPLKALLERFYGIWHPTRQLIPQVGGPIGGSVRNDVNGTLQGIWFYDHENDDTWGKKIAMFSPYCLNHSNYQIRLSIPEVSIYGNWQNITMNQSGDLNLRPDLVTESSGIVGYLVGRNLGVGEEGLILVQMIDDFHIRLETFEGVNEMPEHPNFTEDSVVLYR